MTSPTMQEAAAEGRGSVDRPILFSAPMVRALLDGRKSMTRRLAWGKKCPRCKGTSNVIDPAKHPTHPTACPRCRGTCFVTTPWQRVKSGDLLWVKEDLQRFNREPRSTVQYVADTTGVPHRGQVEGWCDGRAYWNWKVKYLTGRFCPRWASRLTLIVTATKIERVQEISREDAIAEGMKLTSNQIEEFYRWPPPYDAGMWLTTPAAFGWLWRQLHGNESWDANPEVVALTFTVHKANIAAIPKQVAA